MADPKSDLIFDPNGGMDRLLLIMECLRDPEVGCPWDIEQNWMSIAPYTIEEAYEVADAIQREAWDELKGELGDLLLQVVYFAQMGREDGKFDFAAIADGISDKMVERHPHVFGAESNQKSAEQQIVDWESQKASERAKKGEGRVLDGVALGLPALTRALKLQKRAARVGFDWTESRDILLKLSEEVSELIEEIDGGDAAKVEEEFGDLLFVMVNLARHMKIDPERALRLTNDKFTRRFNGIEAALEANGQHPSSVSLDEMDALWKKMKEIEKGHGTT